MSVTYDKLIGKPLMHKHKAGDLDIDLAAAPVGQSDGYFSVVGDTVYYFAGGNRYKITATLDNPAVATDRYASLWFLFGNVHN